MPRKYSRSYRPEVASLSIPEKANKVLHLVLIALFLIVLRVWHLAVIQSDEREEAARRPQRRVVIEPAKRATIRDRYNIPLAINKIQYNAAIVYAQFREIKAVEWKTDADGKKVKVNKRKEYISSLSELLGSELGLDSSRIEDLIYAKASFQSNVPYVIKEDLTEQEYYRLKMLEKDWLGVQVTHVPKRFYPQGRVGADIIGYMGAINRNEYDSILNQMRALEDYVKALETDDDPPMPEGINSPLEAHSRLRDLKERAYTINDHVGKVGVEGRFEETLRGFHGKKQYFSDAKGNYLRELPGSREPLSGQRLLLTISAELQDYTEKLLIQNEEIRKARLSNNKGARLTLPEDKQPWIKGGAILAMDPQTGDIIAMASHPRYDPNDFTPSGSPEEAKVKRSNIARWFESDTYLAEVWDQIRPRERELYDAETEECYDDRQWLTWDIYLNTVLSKDSSIRYAIQQVSTVEKAVDLQLAAFEILEISGVDNLYQLLNLLYSAEPHIAHGPKLNATQKEAALQRLDKNPQSPILKRKLDKYLAALTHQYDKVLLIDLIRIATDADRFDDNLLQAVGGQSLDTYRKASAAKASLMTWVRASARDLFHETQFAEWREQNEKAFLKEKRQFEVLNKKAPRPYIDYLDAKEAELFKEYWDKDGLDNLLAFLNGTGEETPGLLQAHFIDWHREIKQGAHQHAEWRSAYDTLKNQIKLLTKLQAKAYLASLRSYQELTRTLYGRYRQLRHESSVQKEKHLAAAFYPLNGYGYGRSQVYRQAATQGSIFKLVTAYEALIQRFRQMKELGLDRFSLNPLDITDSVFKQGKDLFVAYANDGKPIARHYKGGRLPRTAAMNAGKMDVVKAIEVSSNVYFALLAGDSLNDPNDLGDSARMFSFGARTGVDLPGEIRGNVPNDLDINRTGLYSTSIGQHTLVVTPLQTGVMLSALANGGRVLKPKILHMTAGRQPDRGEDLMHCPPKFCYQDCLGLCGIDFPLYTAVGLQDHKSLVKHYGPELKREVHMPDEVHEMLMEGMRRVVIRTQAESLGALSNVYRDHPEAISDYVELKEQLLGKTSTAESMERIDLDLEKGVNMFLHVWFGGIAYEEPIKNAYVSKDALGKPELVVVVYLRYGGYGKEAAPIAAQVVKKWREIKAQHSK